MATGPVPAEPPPSPEDLTLRISRGDREAEAEFVRLYQPGIRALVRRHTRPQDPAVDDIVQEALQAVLKALRNNEIRESVSGYVRSVVVFTARAEKDRRDRFRQDPETDIEHIPDFDDPLRRVTHNELASRVRAIIRDLKTERDRELLERFYLLEESKSDVCRALGIEESHFRRVMFRARERLKISLAEAGVGGG